MFWSKKIEIVWKFHHVCTSSILKMCKNSISLNNFGRDIAYNEDIEVNVKNN